MSRYYILDDEKNEVPSDMYEWGAWMESDRDGSKRRVAFDETPNGEVSTVFLGLNHGSETTILLYETMVFGGTLEGEQERYTTRQEALEGHAEMVKRVTT